MSHFLCLVNGCPTLRACGTFKRTRSNNPPLFLITILIPQMGVVVEEIELPKRLQFLSKKVSKIVGNGGVKQAEQWLAEMIKAGAPVAEAA